MPEPIILTREHSVLASRKGQLQRNLLAYNGGRPYINARLSRHPCEIDSSWLGEDGSLGRRERAFLLNYARRIADKINQYVFSGEISRAGIDPLFEKDASRTGLTINGVMKRLSAYYTSGQWAWIGIDRPGAMYDESGKPIKRSVLEKERSGDRVFWTIWKSTEVVDWSFAQDGKLRWLITEACWYDNQSEEKAAVEKLVRTIWKPGGGTRIVFKDNKSREAKNVESQEDFQTTGSSVPFVCIGHPSSDPHWFDDIEGVQASLLNLESAHDENLRQSVFPQLVLPAGILDSLMSQPNMTHDEAVKLVRGLNYPILEPDEAKGVTRYLVPPASDIEAIPREIIRRRKELFDVVGMALSKDTKQVESAEAKAWDRMDPEAVLSARAQELEEAETAAIQISKQLDKNFQEYVPEYPREFDISDVSQDFQNLLSLDSFSLPDSAKRETMRAAVKLLGKMVKIDPERLESIEEEINGFEFAPGLADVAAAFGGFQQSSAGDQQV